MAGTPHSTARAPAAAQDRIASRRPGRASALILALAWLGLAGAAGAAGAENAPCRAVGHDSRIDLDWSAAAAADAHGYNLYRAEQQDGPFEKLNADPLRGCLYSDFIGRNDQSCWYKVAPIANDGAEAAPLTTVHAQTRGMSDDELLTSVQEATFRYFWDFGHPVSGLARERSSDDGSICCTGGTGFGLMAIMIGAERGFVPRALAAQRVASILAFLQDKVDRFHGAFPHWMDGATGKTLPFSPSDNGGDIVETSFLVEGLLAMRQYFDGGDPVEAGIRKRATELWEGVEWDWYLQSPHGRSLYWHWSPDHGWENNLRVGGGFNETMVTYLLAIASPTHPIPAECYYEGWVGAPDTYRNGTDYYGHTQWVGRAQGGPLFFTHYSFIGLDPRGLRDRFCDYFENNRNISLINRSYCIENPNRHEGYGQLVWGLTSSIGPDGYAVHSPGRDDGTIAPTAAISAMPYIPEESLATLKYLYHTFGKQLWGAFGFKDAFNLGRGWFSNTYLAIDQGPIICMIENHRTGLCWKMFMKNPEIGKAIRSISPPAEQPAAAADHPPVPASAPVTAPNFERAPVLMTGAASGR
jgi:hypothetical protein